MLAARAPPGPPGARAVLVVGRGWWSLLLVFPCPGRGGVGGGGGGGCGARWIRGIRRSPLVMWCFWVLNEWMEGCGAGDGGGGDRFGIYVLDAMDGWIGIVVRGLRMVMYRKEGEREEQKTWGKGEGGPWGFQTAVS